MKLLVFITTVLSVVAKATELTTVFYPCYQNYALCTTASCVEDTTTPDMLDCACEVYRNKTDISYLSIGTKPCTEVLPSDYIVYSLFSAYNVNDVDILTCRHGEFGDCLNQPCSIRESDSTIADCKCPAVTFPLGKAWTGAKFKTERHKRCNDLSGATPITYRLAEEAYKYYSNPSTRSKL